MQARTLAGRSLTVVLACLVAAGVWQYSTPEATFLNVIAVATVVVAAALWLLALMDLRQNDEARDWTLSVAMLPIVGSALYFFRPRR